MIEQDPSLLQNSRATDINRRTGAVLKNNTQGNPVIIIFGG